VCVALLTCFIQMGCSVPDFFDWWASGIRIRVAQGALYGTVDLEIFWGEWTYRGASRVYDLSASSKLAVTRASLAVAACFLRRGAWGYRVAYLCL